MLVEELLAFISSKPDRMGTLLNEFNKEDVRSALKMAHPSCVLGKTKQDAINAIVMNASLSTSSPSTSSARVETSSARVETQLVHQDQAHGDQKDVSKNKNS